MAKKAITTQRTFSALGSIPTMPQNYYSGDRPNNNLQSFVQQHHKALDLATDTYSVSAFSQPITTTKATAIYNMHSYHQGKKPHDAIRQYISHYTNTGDLILDPFAGSGSTALASLMEGRAVIAIDRSPAATFITKNYCTPIHPSLLQRGFEELKGTVQQEIDWLYATRCDRCGGAATTAFTLYSQQFKCPRCLATVPLFDCDEAEGSTGSGKPKKITVCPACKRKGHLEEINTRTERFGAIPVLIGYDCQAGCSPSRAVRRHNDLDPNKRRHFDQWDLAKINEIEAREVPYWCPPHRMMNVEDDSQPWGEKWRAGTSNFRTVKELFTKRNLWALSAYFSAAQSAVDPHICDAFRFGLTSILLAMSKMQGYVEDPRFPNQLMRGTYYLPQISREYNVGQWLDGKLKNLVAGYRRVVEDEASTSLLISTQSATCLDDIPGNTVDYIFTDPPYSRASAHSG